MQPAACSLSAHRHIFHYIMPEYRSPIPPLYRQPTALTQLTWSPKDPTLTREANKVNKVNKASKASKANKANKANKVNKDQKKWEFVIIHIKLQMLQLSCVVWTLICYRQNGWISLSRMLVRMCITIVYSSYQTKPLCAYSAKTVKINKSLCHDVIRPSTIM